jgi:hypothetical protein
MASDRRRNSPSSSSSSSSSKELSYERPGRYGHDHSYGAREFAQSTGSAISVARETFNKESSILEEVGSLAVKSIPFMLVGALLGTFVKVTTILAEKHSETAAAESKNDKAFIKFPRVGSDASLTLPIKHLQPFLNISPNWLPLLCGHLESLCKSWERFYEMTARAEKLCGVVKNLPSKKMDNNNNTTNNTGESSSASSSSDVVENTIDALIDLFSSNSGRKDIGEVKAEYQKCTGNLELAQDAFETITAYLDESTAVLHTAYKTKVCISGLLSELYTTISLFNQYWIQAGPIISAEPSMIVGSVYAEELIELKIRLAEYLMSTGLLPKKFEGLDEGKLTMPYIQYWIAQHTLFQPSMLAVAEHFQWTSAFNPSAEERSASLQQLQQQSDDDRKNMILKSQRSLLSRGMLPYDASDYLRNQFYSEYIPGHSFQESKDEYDARMTAIKKNMERQYGTKLRDPTITRPTSNHSFMKHGLFVKKRVETEDFKTALSTPWAGFRPATDEKSFLQTVVLDREKAKLIMQKLMTVVDRKMSGMFLAQETLIKIAFQLGDLKRYYQDKISKGEDDMLKLHAHWNNTKKAQSPGKKQFNHPQHGSSSAGVR